MSESRAALRRAVHDRARGCCEYCRCPSAFSPQPFSLEHIEPLSKGGQTIFENLAWSCQGCNNHKYDQVAAKDPVTSNITRLFQPRIHNWREHFAWTNDFTNIVGLTDIGRATVQALKLNRTPVVNLRRLLVAVLEHPPPDSIARIEDLSRSE